MDVAMRDGLFKSTNAGETWNSLGKSLKNMAAVTINPRKTNEVYAATTEGVIFKSSDRGTTWKKQ